MQRTDARLYFGCAERSIRAEETIDALQSELQNKVVTPKWRFIPALTTAFGFRNGPVYNKPARSGNWERLFTLFGEALALNTRSPT